MLLAHLSTIGASYAIPNFMIVNENLDTMTRVVPYYNATLHDDFGGSTYTLNPLHYSPNRNWYGMWNGDGYMGTAKDSNTTVFVLNPKASAAKNETHSALAISTSVYKNFKLGADIKIDKQKRKYSPHPWEGGWILWHWNDSTHHYYVALKTTGQEIGKYDGGTNPASQLILRTTDKPPAEVGEWDHLELTVVNNHATAVIDGIKTFDFYDKSSFDSGRIAMYCEDSKVSFDNVFVTPLA